MRLIDADKLCEDLLTRWELADKNKEELIRRVMADIVTPIVVGQPTADAVERKKGKWIDRGYMKVGFHCSVCGGYAISGKDNFCPHCGADMRGEAND